MAGTLNLGLGRADINSCGSSERGNGVINAIEGARDTGLIDLDMRDAQRVPYCS
jgi:SLT domain-containing protein